MVKGITANNVSNTPGAIDNQFQLNLDGQQITQRVAGSGFGQPKVSREAIAEFQIVTNMFDITQGRSTGMQVQAISRSGTNDMRASAYGFFRDDSAERAGSDRAQGAAVPEPAGRRHARRADRAEQDALLRLVSNTSASRRTSSWRRRACRIRPSSSRPRTVNKNYLARVDMQESSRDTISVRVPALGVQQPVLDLERHRPPVHGRQPEVRTPPTSPARGRARSTRT